MQSGLLLDTCALLWLASGDGALSRQIIERIDDVDSVYVSAITGFEIALKHAKGKFILPKTPQQWFDGVLRFNNIEVIALGMEVCILSTQLPFHHQDPCDRFIIATGILFELPVVTSDSVFKQYDVDVLS